MTTRTNFYVFHVFPPGLHSIQNSKIPNNPLPSPPWWRHIRKNGPLSPVGKIEISEQTLPPWFFMNLENFWEISCWKSITWPYEGICGKYEGISKIWRNVKEYVKHMKKYVENVESMKEYIGNYEEIRRYNYWISHRPCRLSPEKSRALPFIWVLGLRKSLCPSFLLGSRT